MAGTMLPCTKDVLMLGYDALHLARAQFAFTVAFHIVFPAFSIGLASYLAVLAYTAHAYWVFRGKVQLGAGYH